MAARHGQYPDADTLIADEEKWKIEKEKVTAALRLCGYPKWALKRGELRGKRQLRNVQEKQKGSDHVEDRKSKQCAVLPYIKGITERLQRALRKHNIAWYARQASQSGIPW